MGAFLADLHIHSRFSRATSSRLTVPHLAVWSRLKGLAVTATGDFTHPGWREELRSLLVRDDASGLYKLKSAPDIAHEAPGYTAPAGDSDPRGPLFVLEAEISSIYKKDGAVRKVHNLVYMPDLDSVDRLCRKLEQIGNLASDGRPILGLDSRDLLEMVLETDERGVLIPAHIWTPWFSLFGSRSGFDSVEACFGDLSPHIFAMETGLSSDPDMNRCWSALDRMVMVSSSDAHSGENLGREATAFSGSPSYEGMFGALRRAAAGEEPAGDCAWNGTLEFFPEEGKYHLDGHRACQVVLDPEETRRLHNRCPVCGRELTVGVLNRVMALADRKEPRPPAGTGFVSLIPLAEIVGELLGVGSKSVKVRARCAELLGRLGPELEILCRLPEDTLRHEWDLLGEAVSRMRRGHVFRQGGYDGEYGVVRVFAPEERDRLCGSRRSRQGVLSAAPRAGASALTPAGVPAPGLAGRGVQPAAAVMAEGHMTRLPEEACAGDDGVAGTPERAGFRKRKAAGPASHLMQPVLLLADAGKDRRMQTPGKPAPCAAHTDGSDPGRDGPSESVAPALREQAEFSAATVQETPPVGVLAESWSAAQRKAIMAGPGPVLVLAGPGAGKTRTLIGRLTRLLDEGIAADRLAAVTFTRRAAGELRDRLKAASAGAGMPAADTLHALALPFWLGKRPIILAEESARAAFARCAADSGLTDRKVLRAAFDRLALCRERLTSPEEADRPLLERYTTWKRERGLADYTDLLENWLARLVSGEVVRPWDALLVDEIQDLSPLQLALLRALLPSDGRGFFGIGDPDQAIYGFRGAQPDVAAALASFWPGLQIVTLDESYRAGEAILTSARALLAGKGACGSLHAARDLPARLKLFSAPDAAREAAWIAGEIGRLLGDTSHTLADARRQTDALAGSCSPGELAVLVRLKALMPPLREALFARGIPVAVPEAEAFWDEPRVALLLGMAARMWDRPAALPDTLPPSLLSLDRDVWREGPDAVLAACASTPPFDPLVRDLAAFRELRRRWREAGSWEALLDWVCLRQELDLAREAGEKVRIMTIHAAKGLEFRAVFLPALEEGLLPFAGPDLTAPGMQVDALLAKSSEAIEEERRLLYVGVTRASEAVYASHAARRRLYGRELALAPSRFLSLLPDLVVRTRLVRHTKVSSTQMSLL
ncbi:MAG TPA: UvrD-helicase domain-containing protein [Candidatus Avidesulfovibrio excrementigallinarum]|nr:UvrD-helicase domain-containing protein [Candidatus Avidesulfovibrio excrementigallinarum]